MDSRSSDRKIQLGVFGKPFGLKGYVYLRYHGNEPKGLLEFKELFLTDSCSSIRIEKIKLLKGRLTVKLYGVDDRNKAITLKDQEIFVIEKDLPSLIQGEFYWYQLENLKVINEEQDLLGIIDYIMETGANDVLVIKPLPESIDNLERLIPFSMDVVIRKVDLENKSVYVRWPKNY